MSLVLTCFSPDFVGIVCDGRTSLRDQTGNLIPLRENYQKAWHLSERIIFASTGCGVVGRSLFLRAKAFADSRQADADLFQVLVEFITKEFPEIRAKANDFFRETGTAVILTGFDAVLGRMRHIAFVLDNNGLEVFEDSEAGVFAIGNADAVALARQIGSVFNPPSVDVVLPFLEYVGISVADGVPWSVNRNLRFSLILRSGISAPEQNGFKKLDVFNAEPSNSDLAVLTDGTNFARTVASDLTSNRIDFSKGLLNKHLDNIPDGATFKRILYVNSDNTFHVSSAFNQQASMMAYSVPTGWLSYTDTTFEIDFSWNATTVTRPDGSTFSLAALSTYAKPSSPTSSTFAGGALAARTRTIAVALCKDGLIYGSSPVVQNVSIGASHLLQINSPASVAGYDGWIPLIGPDPADSFGFPVLNPSTPIAFGANWQEPSTGYTVFGGGSTTINGNSTNCVACGLTANTAYYLYPYVDSNGIVGFGARAQTSASDSLVQTQIKDGNHSLMAGNYLSITTPSSGSGSGSVGGGGGRGLL